MFNLVLIFTEGFLNLTAFFNLLCAYFVLLFVYAYSYVGFKSSLDLVL
jgi:hypothetical protein